METRVHFTRMGSSLSSLPQMGSNYSEDRICWRATMGGFFGSWATSSHPLSAACSSAMKPFLSVKNSRRTQTELLADDAKRGKVFTFVDGDMHLIRHRMTRRHDQTDTVGSGRKNVRSFVDEATVHSADIELSNPSAISQRGDGETGELDLDTRDDLSEPDEEPLARIQSFSGVNDRVLDQKIDGKQDQKDEEDGEYGPGIKILEAENLPSVDYKYEDMRLGEKKNWSIVDMKKIDILRDFDYRQGCEKGVFVVQAMRVEHMKATEELLVDSFAELMGGILTYRPLLALTVRQYVRDRYSCLPDAVTLVGLYAPAEDNVVMGRTENEFSGNWLLAGTVELSFSNAGHPDIPAGPAPPPGSPYLCNMAVSSAHRRRGLGRQILKAAEELAVTMGAQDLYLHCRMVDLAPLNMYQGAGYQIVATDSILSLLSFQRRRYLMHKRLQGPTMSDIS